MTTSPRPDPERDQIRALTAQLASDLRQWLEWGALTGADEVPFEPPTAAAPAPRAPSPRDMASPVPRDPPPPRTSTSRPMSSPSGPSSSSPVPRVSPRAAGSVSVAPPPTGDVARGEAGLVQVRAELGNCQRCRLSKDRKNLVFGVGSPTAPLVLVGEAPGEMEDKLGEPFVGRSGQLLTRMLDAIGLQRDDVYICNVIKCRPPQNRDPLADEISTCSPFLFRQLEAIGPRVIMTLGRYAAMNVLGREGSLGELRGQVASVRGVPVVPTYHPSYLLRTPHMKRQAWADFLVVRRLLQG